MNRQNLRDPYPFHGMQSTIADDNRRARAALDAFKTRQRARRNRRIAGYAVAALIFLGLAAALFYSF